MAHLSWRASSAALSSVPRALTRNLSPPAATPRALLPIPSARTYSCPRGALNKRARLLLAPAPASSPAPAPASSPAPAPATTTAAERAAAAADALLSDAANDLVLPSRRAQPPLARDKLRALRAESEALAKSKKLVRVQVGAKGLSAAVINSAAGALAGAPSGLVRVRLGDGCGLERRSAAVAMERLLDAVCVKQVGFCVTLYRDRALPRPDNVPPAAGAGGGGGGVAVVAAGAEDGAAEAAEAAAAEEDEAEAPAATRQDTGGGKGGGRRKSAGAGVEAGGGSGDVSGSAAPRKKKERPPTSPPAFTVV